MGVVGPMIHKDIKPPNTKEARKLIGKEVRVTLRNSKRICGLIYNVVNREMYISDDWVKISDIIEMKEL